ncbi:YabP/YqfC family sporulation protein [uncultured Oscillibacter sp.]|uniref:YabP/YqfC family sporulation protein n=1 Tax=uncultured Oscillibacter sp. TaxID=876091 RepID=UPI0025F08560|nr:YabP/YqfC family sporulation protein [uncultured Oscillibacter sp.]
MERNRKERGSVLGSVAELFDLPADVIAGLPHLEMVGSRQLYLERHTGILSYSETQIDINTPGGVLRVRGGNLALTAMTAEELRLGGRIDALEWVR